MVRRSLPIAGCLAVALLVACTLPALAAGSTTTRVYGSIVQGDGTPVAGALVVARPKELPEPPEG